MELSIVDFDIISYETFFCESLLKKLKIKSYSTFDIPEIESILKKFNTNSLIIRPDRFVLASTDKSDLKEFSRFYLNEIFAS